MADCKIGMKIQLLPLKITGFTEPTAVTTNQSW